MNLVILNKRVFQGTSLVVIFNNAMVPPGIFKIADVHVQIIWIVCFFMKSSYRQMHACCNKMAVHAPNLRIPKQLSANPDLRFTSHVPIPCKMGFWATYTICIAGVPIQLEVKNKTNNKNNKNRTLIIITTERVTLTVQIKNWLPLVLGPAFAILTTPGPTCVTAKVRHFRIVYIEWQKVERENRHGVTYT